MDGYKWTGNNRNNMHKRTARGPGGVGVFIRNEMYEEFDILTLNKVWTFMGTN